MIQDCNFSVSEPLMVQCKIFDHIQTLTREHLRPTFPDLPTGVVAGFDRYYGLLNEDNHNLYEKIPGVLAKAVRHTISDERVGSYQSVLSRLQDELIVNTNLLGFQPLQSRKPEAKNLAYDAGIIPDRFPAAPRNTGINIQFPMSISTLLAQTKTFKLSNVDFNTLSNNGSIVRATMQQPIIETADDEEKRGEIYSFTNFRDQDSNFGLGVVYTLNLFKGVNKDEESKTWACVIHIHGLRIHVYKT